MKASTNLQADRPPLIPLKLAQRLSELDMALMLPAGQGLTERIMGDLIDTIISTGRDAWAFIETKPADIEQARKVTAKLATKWRLDDKKAVSDSDNRNPQVKEVA